jgi:hypothetical protein
MLQLIRNQTNKNSNCSLASSDMYMYHPTFKFHAQPNGQCAKVKAELAILLMMLSTFEFHAQQNDQYAKYKGMKYENIMI